VRILNVVKYFLYGFSSFLFLTNAYAGSQPESLAKIIYEKEIDLNQDRIKDKLVIEENTEGKRNLKILVEDSKKQWNTVIENRNMVLCKDCGGVSTGDPLVSVEAKRNVFEITQEGGSRERWTSVYRFQYSPKLSTWILRKARLNVYDTVTGKNEIRRKSINSSKPVKLQDFNYDEFFYN
jgi:hypothetical protein